MKRLAILLSCLAILTLTGCEPDDDLQEGTAVLSKDTISEGTTPSGATPDTTLSPLEEARKEYGRTPDMTYYTYYIGTDIPEELLTPSTEADTLW